jgi:tetratricopeptide (TPR) repeat protein
MEQLDLNDEESMFLNAMLHDQELMQSTQPCTTSGRPQSDALMASRIDELEQKMLSSQLSVSEAHSSSPVIVELLSAYHQAAMKCMESGPSKQAAAFELLQKAQLLGERRLPGESPQRRVWLTAIYSSLAVYFQRAKKYEAALLYLQQVADLEQDVGAGESIAGTSLNIAAVLLSLRRHSQALVEAERATQALLGFLDPPCAASLDEAAAVDLVSSGRLPLSRLELLTKAYYNIGAIKEHLSRLKEALEAYKVAACLARGRDPSFLKMVEAAALDVRKRLSKSTRGRELRSASLKHRSKEGATTEARRESSRPKSAVSSAWA